MGFSLEAKDEGVVKGAHRVTPKINGAIQDVLAHVQEGGLPVFHGGNGYGFPVQVAEHGKVSVTGRGIQSPSHRERNIGRVHVIVGDVPVERVLEKVRHVLARGGLPIRLEGKHKAVHFPGFPFRGTFHVRVLDVRGTRGIPVVITIAIRIVREAINRRRDGGCLAPEKVVQCQMETILIKVRLDDTRAQYILVNILVHVQG